MGSEKPVGLREASGDGFVSPRSKSGSGVWRKNWGWAGNDHIGGAAGAKEEGEICYKRLKAERCSTPLCFKHVKPNYLGEVTKLCHSCIDEQVQGFNQLKRKGDGGSKVVKGNTQDKENK